MGAQHGPQLGPQPPAAAAVASLVSVEDIGGEEYEQQTAGEAAQDDGCLQRGLQNGQQYSINVEVNYRKVK